MEQFQAMEESLTIQQMVQITGLSAHTLRYYERAGLMQQRVERHHSYEQKHAQQKEGVSLTKT